MDENKLTPDQVEKLVDAASISAHASWSALRSGKVFTPEQQQKLVDGAAKCPVSAASVLKDIPWLREEQKHKLTLVA